MLNQASTVKRRQRITNSQLPPDIIEEILLTLPLKSVTRFTFVSKQWRKQITDSLFAKAHSLKHQMDYNDSKVIFCDYNMEQNRTRILMVDVNKSIEEGLRTQVAINSPIPGRLRFRCCCEGILCFDNCVNLVLLWNPITNWYRTIRLPRLLVRDFVIPLIGFGYDAANEDYKLVLMHSKVVQVMSLKSNSWRKWRNDFPCAGMNYLEKAVHVNGILYWFVPGPNIISFDLRTETFKEVKKPSIDKELWINRLITWDGKLCMVVEPRKKYRGRFPQIWSMEEDYNWVRIYSKSFGNILKKIYVSCSNPQLLKFGPRIVDYNVSLVSPQ